MRQSVTPLIHWGQKKRVANEASHLHRRQIRTHDEDLDRVQSVKMVRHNKGI